MENDSGILNGDVVLSSTAEGPTRADLKIGGRSVSRLWIWPFTIRIGAATVRMDGIGGVGTDDEYRNRGCARQVLDAAVAHMRQGDAALSMLYGIQDFYPKFGYATAGADYFVTLTELERETVLPAGWRVRPFVADDLPSVRSLYERSTARAVGAAVRPKAARSWSRLARTADEGNPDECRVVENPQGQVAAYAWRGKEFWTVTTIEKHDPKALVLAEVVADGPQAADAVLAACRIWAGKESTLRPKPLQRLFLSMTPDDTVAAAAMHQSAEIACRFSRCGGSMARVISVGRLLDALRPELEERMRAARCSFTGTLQLRTDMGDALLAIAPEGLSVRSPDLAGQERSAAVPLPAERGAETLAVCLPQTALARLALGVFPTADMLARLEEPPCQRAQALMEVLFPLRCPQMHLPDRY